MTIGNIALIFVVLVTAVAGIVYMVRKNKNQDKLENDTKCTKYHNISYAQNNEMHKNVRLFLTKI